MFRGIFIFGAGVYTGMYIAQNYEIRPVDKPLVLWEDLKNYADKYKK